MSIDDSHRIKNSKPSTLRQQIKRAQKEMKSWSPERRASLVLQGGAATTGDFFTSIPGSKHG